MGGARRWESQSEADQPETIILHPTLTKRQLRMDCNKLWMLAAALVAALCVCASGMSIPKDAGHSNSFSDEVLDEPDRATYLDTRTNEISKSRDDFEKAKEIVLYALIELQNENLIEKIVNDDIQKTEKRGRWQGFCFRRVNGGRYLPYICWKGG